MQAYKKAKTCLSSLYGMSVFKDWDKCCICKEFKSPLIWIRNHNPKEWDIYFVCEECYEKIKGAG